MQGNSSATLAAAVAGVFNYGIPSISAVLQDTAGASGALLPAGTGLSINFPEAFDAGRVAFTRADAATDAELVALPGAADGAAVVAYDGPVLTDDPLAEGNAFLRGYTTVRPIDGNYGSAEIGACDRIASLLGTAFGVPADTVLA